MFVGTLNLKAPGVPPGAFLVHLACFIQLFCLSVRLPSARHVITYMDMCNHAVVLTREEPGGSRVWKRDRALILNYERPDAWEALDKIGCPTLLGCVEQIVLYSPTTLLCACKSASPTANWWSCQMPDTGATTRTQRTSSEQR